MLLLFFRLNHGARLSRVDHVSAPKDDGLAGADICPGFLDESDGAFYHRVAMLGEFVGGFVGDAKVFILKFLFKRALVFVFCASLMLAVRRPLVMDRCLNRSNAGHILVHGLHHRVLVRQIPLCCLHNRPITLRGGL